MTEYGIISLVSHFQQKTNTHWGKADDRNCSYGHPKMADMKLASLLRNGRNPRGPHNDVADVDSSEENFETKVLRSLDEILDRQKKLEEQVTSFLLTPGDSDDLLEDLIPKPINSEQEFDRFGMELQEKVYRRKMALFLAAFGG